MLFKNTLRQVPPHTSQVEKLTYANKHLKDQFTDILSQTNSIVDYLQSPFQFPTYAYASLPSTIPLKVGQAVFCTDGLDVHDTAGHGTGCLCVIKSVSGTNTWCAVWSGVAVTH